MTDEKFDDSSTDDEQDPRVIYDKSGPDQESHKVIFDSGVSGIQNIVLDSVSIEQYEKKMLRILQINLKAGRLTQSGYELARMDLNARIKQYLQRLDN